MQMFLEKWPNLLFQTKIDMFHKRWHQRIISQVPMHGDQLFEEHARNVQWTFRVENSAFEQLEGITTEFADWHAKVTLYKACEAYMTYLYCLHCIKLFLFLLADTLYC